MEVKEVKIKLTLEEHRRLKRFAKRNLRSMNKQIQAFIQDGLRIEKELQGAERG